MHFKSKRAAQNYALLKPDCDVCDDRLLDKSVVSHIKHTRAFRRDRRDLELRFRGGSHCALSDWLDDWLNFSGDECLFLPNAVCFRPQRVLYNYKRMSAARAMLIKSSGLPEQDDLVVRHKCGMGHMSCVNPKHLAWGTSQDNAEDRSLHMRKTYAASDCPDNIRSELASDGRLTSVIAWDRKIPSGLVSAVKLADQN